MTYWVLFLSLPAPLHSYDCRVQTLSASWFLCDLSGVCQALWSLWLQAALFLLLDKNHTMPKATALSPVPCASFSSQKSLFQSSQHFPVFCAQGHIEEWFGIMGRAENICALFLALSLTSCVTWGKTFRSQWIFYTAMAFLPPCFVLDIGKPGICAAQHVRVWGWVGINKPGRLGVKGLRWDLICICCDKTAWPRQVIKESI